MAATSTTTAFPGAETAELNPHRRGAMLLVLLTGQALAAMNNAIINVAAPAIRDDLAASGALLQLIIASYLLAYAVLLIPAAQLGEGHGYRRLFMTGVALFTAGSLASGLAPDAHFLVAARVVQGAGAALLVPQVLSLIQRHFEGEARARVVGYYSLMSAIGVTAGQILGGIIVTVNILGLSWRPAFLMNVPIGVALFFYAAAVLPAAQGQAKHKLDLAGVAVLILAVTMALVPLIFGRQAGWPSWTWMSLALGLAALVLFFIIEARIARRGGIPLLDVAIFNSGGVTAGLLVVFIGFICFGGLLFATALYFQSGLGFSPLKSALVFAAYSTGFGAANLVWSQMPPWAVRWLPAAAMMAMAAAAWVFGIVALRWSWQPFLMLSLLLFAGAAHGFAFGPAVNQTAARIDPAHIPALSGLVAMATQIAIVVGLATLGTLYLASITCAPSSPPSAAIAYVAQAIACITLACAACALRLALSLPSDCNRRG